MYGCTIYTVFQKIISNWFCCSHISIIDVCTVTEGGYIGTATLHQKMISNGIINAKYTRSTLDENIKIYM